MDTIIQPAELVSDFSYALEVLEESDHLGLDEQHARLLREILQRRIEEARAALSVECTEPIQIFVDSRMSA